MPSQTNFVYADIGRDADAFQAKMRAENVLIRGVYEPYKTWSRVSMGKLEDLERFVQTSSGLHTPSASDASVLKRSLNGKKGGAGRPFSFVGWAPLISWGLGRCLHPRSASRRKGGSVWSRLCPSSGEGGLLAQAGYALMLTQGQGQVLASEALAQLSPAAREALQRELHQAASQGVGAEGHQLAASQNPDLRAVLEAVNTPETLAQVRALTGSVTLPTPMVRPRAIAVAIFSLPPRRYSRARRVAYV